MSEAAKTEGNFFEAGTDAILLDELTLAGRTSVLVRLGPAQFRSKGFSFIGFLETLYDHVAEQSNSSIPIPPAAAIDETPVFADAVDDIPPKDLVQFDAAALAEASPELSLEPTSEIITEPPTEPATEEVINAASVDRDDSSTASVTSEHTVPSADDSTAG